MSMQALSGDHVQITSLVNLKKNNFTIIKHDEKYQFFTALIRKRALLSVLLTLVTLVNLKRSISALLNGFCLSRVTTTIQYIPIRLHNLN